MYTILTDSCSDLNAEVAAKFDHFEVIPLSYTISGETSFQPFDDAQRCSPFTTGCARARRAQPRRFRRAILSRRLSRMPKRARRCSASFFPLRFPARMPPHAWRGTLCTRITPTR